MIRTTYLMTTFLAAILLTGLGIVSVSDIRFGRLGRRFEEVRGRATTDVLEQILGRPVPAILQDKMVHGADELDLVRSGLDDTKPGIPGNPLNHAFTWGGP